MIESVLIPPVPKSCYYVKIMYVNIHIERERERELQCLKDREKHLFSQKNMRPYSDALSYIYIYMYREREREREYTLFCTRHMIPFS